MAFARWLYAPTGRKVIAQGKAKRRPGIRYATKVASPERAERTHGETNARCTHRGRAPTATLYPAHPGWRFALPWAISLCPVGANNPVTDQFWLHIAGDPSCVGLVAMAFARWLYAPTGRKVIAKNAGTVPGYSNRSSWLPIALGLWRVWIGWGASEGEPRVRLFGFSPEGGTCLPVCVSHRTLVTTQLFYILQTRQHPYQTHRI